MIGTENGDRGMPLVSIIIPVYNGSLYLAEAIDSALGQSYPNTEVLVVDDGSNDGGATAAICAEYGDQIRYIAKPNGGVASALNRGIAEMHGDYFSWLSHDDRYRHDKIRVQIECAQSYTQPVVVFSNADLIDSVVRSTGQASLVQRWDPRSDARLLVIDGRISGCTVLVPRIGFEECGGFSEDRPTTQDVAFWFELAERFPFVFSPEINVESRIHALQGSNSAGHFVEAGLTFIEFYKRLAHDDGLDQADMDRLRHRFIRQHAKREYPGLRPFCQRLLRESRKATVPIVIDVGVGITGRVAQALIDEGFGGVQLAGGTALPHNGGRLRRTLSTALWDRDDDTIIVLVVTACFDPAILAPAIDRLLGRECDSIVWPAEDTAFGGVVTRLAQLRHALARLGSSLDALPWELAIVGRTTLPESCEASHG